MTKWLRCLQVIPRYNVRGRNRSSSAKYSNSASLLAAGVAVRSNSFRVNRNNNNSSSAGTPDFCKHIKYCCLHQNANSVRLDQKTFAQLQNHLDSEAIDRAGRSQEFSDKRVTSIGKHLKFSELNTNNYSNFSDDEKSMTFIKKPPSDLAANSSSGHNKSLQPNYDSFENRKCNCGKLLIKCLHTPPSCVVCLCLAFPLWCENECKELFSRLMERKMPSLD